MHQKQQESGGGPPLAEQVTLPETKFKRVEFTRYDSSSPFGQPVDLESISGSDYVTGQLLVQQVAYTLSDKIFSYSPESFDLDVAAREWSNQQKKNAYGYTPDVLSLQTRTGAGTFELGYIFSEDFDLSKRHTPQTLLAPSLSLRHLRASLDQLALLYGVASPFVAHIAAADYSADAGLVSDYGTALELSEELGLGLVSSSTAYEAQHMALFSTLLARVLPTIHIYDGLHTSRETLPALDALTTRRIGDTFTSLQLSVTKLSRHIDSAGKVMDLLNEFNQLLGTKYGLFEYCGHEEAEAVVVVFGSTESQMAKQVISGLAAEGVKVGAISVRVYRPFVEEAFLQALPTSVQNIAVLGQVHTDIAVADASIQSALYADVLTSLSLSDRWPSAPTVVDLKYAASEFWTPTSFASTVHQTITKGSLSEVLVPPTSPEGWNEYIFWDVDDSPARFAPTVVARLLSGDPNNKLYLSETYDNLVQGGVVRSDLKISTTPANASYPSEAADVVFINDERLLQRIAVSHYLKSGGKLVLRLSNFRPEDAEKRIPADVRKDIQQGNIELQILDTSLSPAFEADATALRLLVELAFLGVAQPKTKPDVLQRLSLLEGNQPTIEECIDALEKCFSKFEVPEAWAETTEETLAATTLTAAKDMSFAPFVKEESEKDLQTTDWQMAAKGLVFKEAYETDIALRPDLSVKTYTITVKENRRLTPATYDRNIFHIEFDLGKSGLTYKIGEALGIHADNDADLVDRFIESYGLDANKLVQVPARYGDVLETRTVYQSLIQNIDIFGKPPKRFYELLSDFATDELEKKKLAALGGQEGAEEFKKRSEVDTVTYADVLEEFKSAHPVIADLVRIIGPLKRREYSIASAQAVTPNAVSLMIVVVDWVDSKGRTRYGQATRYLSRLAVGATITASVKPSVMKLPSRDDAPLIMAGLGTGLAPFRAFVQYRAMQKAQGKKIGAILLYLGSRHQREEYLYGEEWEAYLDAGVITLLGAAFSRDQSYKIYIQDRMRQTMSSIIKAYINEKGSFYLCGPTWPVPDVTAVLQEAIETEAKAAGKKVDSNKEIDRLKEEGRYVLEVY